MLQWTRILYIKPCDTLAADGAAIVLNEHGVTEQRWRVLRALMQSGPLEPPVVRGLPDRRPDPGRRAGGKGANRARAAREDGIRPVPCACVADAAQPPPGAKITPLIEARYEGMELTAGGDLLKQVHDTLDRLPVCLGTAPVALRRVASLRAAAPAFEGVIPQRLGIDTSRPKARLCLTP